jgi:endonuclease YncB( thermonuclease family)
MLLILRSLIVLMVLAGPTFALEGRARVVDGDTLELAGQKVRLFGIDAPELDQVCDQGGVAWACGAAEREMLAGLVAGGRLTCSVQDVDQYGRAVAVCLRQDKDVAAQMVRQGGAIAYRRYSDRYVADEAVAQAAGAGVWGSTYAAPEDHRQQGRAQADVQAVPDAGCAIKGNIGRTGKRIYHLPGQADYAATRINERAGERFFCSEAEARAAGFRRAAR